MDFFIQSYLSQNIKKSLKNGLKIQKNKTITRRRDPKIPLTSAQKEQRKMKNLNHKTKQNHLTRNEDRKEEERKRNGF